MKTKIDRDSTRWKLAAKVVEKRRRVFWEVFAQDKWSVSIIPCFFLIITLYVTDCVFVFVEHVDGATALFYD